MYVCICIFICICMCIHISVGINMHICVYIYIYIYIFIAGHNQLWVDGAIPILSINTISHATVPIIVLIRLFKKFTFLTESINHQL